MRTPLTLTLSFCLSMAMTVHGQETYVVEPVKAGAWADDYAPVLVDSTLIFCSLRDRDAVVGYRNEDTDKPFSDLYRLDLGQGADEQPRLLGDALTSSLNDGPATFTDQGDRICFTRNLVTARKLGNTKATDDRLGLFFSSRIGAGWTVPEPFLYNSDVYSVMHAAYSADGQRLYLVSDMPGGHGGMDIYVCEREGDDWDIPVNLGPMVNSKENDIFPFEASNGMLYFSSSRSGGLGGLDIYSCTKNGSGFSSPIAMPEPVNSEKNDLGYTSFTTDRSGYFSSDRDGSDRIFGFRRVMPLFVDCKEQKRNNYCYQFNAPIDGSLAALPLKVQWALGDGNMAEGPVVEHCYGSPGSYTVRLDLLDSATGSLFHNQLTMVMPIEDVRQPYITTLDTIRSGRKVQLDGTHSNMPGFNAEEYHWDLGDGLFASGRAILHEWKAPGSYTIKMDLLGQGNDGRRLASHCVTRTVVVIQRSQDIENAPVMTQYQDASGATRSFEYQVLPSDQFSMIIREGEDATFTIELFARKERMSLDDPLFAEIRKAYRVIERYDPQRGVYSYSVGDAKDLAGLYELYRKVKALHFLDAEVVIIHPEKVTDLSALELLSTRELDRTVVRSSTVYFDKGRSTFGKNFEPQLNKLLEVLDRHAQLSIVIEAHTDATGREDYNLSLSQKRAQSIMEYLVARGVQAERLVPIGHGENNPIASNLTEDGRGLNRRVEFRLQVQGDQAYERRR
jgi:outer membrane protein OmpA-like peptidoglycan-associated protein